MGGKAAVKVAVRELLQDALCWSVLAIPAPLVARLRAVFLGPLLFLPGTPLGRVEVDAISHSRDPVPPAPHDPSSRVPSGLCTVRLSKASLRS